MDLLLREGLELLHIAGVVLQLFQTAHAAEDGPHPVQPGGEPDGPGSQAGGRVGLVQQCGGLLREIHQGAPLHRLHDHDLLAVLPGHLIALPGLDVGVLPVQVVDLKLDQLGLRVVPEDLLQDLRSAVEGEADVPHQPLVPHLPEKLEGAQLLRHGVPHRPQVVEQVVVKVVHPAELQLPAQEGPLILRPADVVQGDLIGQDVLVPGIPLRQSPSDRRLTGLVVVAVGGVKIGEAPLQEAVHHPLHRLHIHGGAVLLVQQGQAHQAKP